jgi:hypothetical protein
MQGLRAVRDQLGSRATSGGSATRWLGSKRCAIALALHSTIHRPFPRPSFVFDGPSRVLGGAVRRSQRRQVGPRSQLLVGRRGHRGVVAGERSRGPHKAECRGNASASCWRCEGHGLRHEVTQLGRPQGAIGRPSRHGLDPGSTDPSSKRCVHSAFASSCDLSVVTFSGGSGESSDAERQVLRVRASDFGVR